jgi:hypothetical protein
MDRWAGIALALVATVFYLVVGQGQTDLDSHWPIAQAFAAGRLHLIEPIPWLELVPRPEGGWYSPFPPLLSVLLVPFAIAGVVIDTNVTGAVFGGVSVALVWLVLLRLGVADMPRLALTVSWAFGSQVLWMATTGGQHLAPQLLAAALLLASIALALDRRWPILAGVLLGAGAASRLPVGLALPLLVYLYRGDGQRDAWVRLLAGLAVPALLVAAYNLARFGDPFEFGYGLIRNVDGESVLDEPWYEHGIVSLRYLPAGLYAMLFKGFEWQDQFPWVVPGHIGASVLLTMPILWWIFDARGRLAIVAGLTAVLILLPDLAHGNPGFAQLGYRYIVDALPVLWLMLGIAFRERLSRAALVAMVVGGALMWWLCMAIWLELQVTG